MFSETGSLRGVTKREIVTLLRTPPLCNGVSTPGDGNPNHVKYRYLPSSHLLVLPLHLRRSVWRGESVNVPSDLVIPVLSLTKSTEIFVCDVLVVLGGRTIGVSEHQR